MSIDPDKLIILPEIEDAPPRPKELYSLPKNITIQSINDIEDAFCQIGVPAIIRPSFTLGGLGSGIARYYKLFVA